MVQSDDWVASPALNAGNSAAASTLTTDQRGSARLVGGIVDIGAFEYGAILVSALADENDGNYVTGDLSLREAIAIAKNTAGDDVIEFVTGLTGTISLSDPLAIDAGFLGNLTIQGAGNEVVTMSAGFTENNVFVLSKDGTSTIESLTIRDLRLTGATVAAIAKSPADLDITIERLDISDNDGAAIVHSSQATSRRQTFMVLLTQLAPTI